MRNYICYNLPATKQSIVCEDKGHKINHRLAQYQDLNKIHTR